MRPPPPLDPTRHALFVDFDGTLVEIAPHPDQVDVPGDLPPRLRALAATVGGRLALVSGRPVTAIDRYTQGAAPYAAGLHGLEWRGPDGTRHGPARAPGIEALRPRLSAFAARRPALYFEDKGVTLSLHYRGAPEAEPELLALAEGLLAEEPGLILQRGKMVVEIRTAGADKGSVVTRLMEAPPFVRHVPVFLGDDLTDEHGFAAAARLGGLGIRIGAPAPSSAACFLPDVCAARDWLFAPRATPADPAADLSR
ncbi:MAG: trehalose-phosphatase [Alphaproteobacteria bacterium]|nr:trehalose-phosphatase [Alphaproteobacteria bacterium]